MEKEVIIIILFAIFFATFVLLTITRTEVRRLVAHHYGQKVDFFRQVPIKPGDIVFVGDSLTEGARWDELFPDKPVINRGINADTVNGVLLRLDDIISGKPAKIFLLIGTNDLTWFEYRTQNEVLTNTGRSWKRSKQKFLPPRFMCNRYCPGMSSMQAESGR